MIQAVRSFFSPAPPAEHIATDPAEIRQGFKYWQPRILFASTFGYAMFYFVRVNLSVAMPAIEKNLHITKTDLGLFLTLHGVIYGVSKFLNGFLGDRSNARTFMSVGLFLSALANIGFGSSSVAYWMGIFWVINGWVQGMGFPPCARLLTHWFPPHRLATKMSIWNISHQVGGSFIQILCGFLILYSWRLCFYVPAGIAILTSIYLFYFLRDTPESLGLPEVEHFDPDPKHHVPPINTAAIQESEVPVVDPAAPGVESQSYSSILREYVFSNPYIWIISLTNFFVYIIRYAMLSWAPTFLSEARGMKLTHAAVITACFEFAGVGGALASGFLTDRLFGGKAARVGVFFMVLCTGVLYLFWRLPHTSEFTAAIMISAVGFLIYGPQCLIGIVAANLATKRAAAAAVGLTGIFGYASTTVSGVGLGWLAQHYGWQKGFLGLIGICTIGTILMAACWNAPVHGSIQKTH